MSDGGVQLLKILSAMHDTCNCANKVAIVLNLLKQENAKNFFGADVWEGMDVSKMKMADYFCGNHTRGLLVAAFNRLFEEDLTGNFGEKIDAATVVSSG